jgi:hypothetical protein
MAPKRHHRQSSGDQLAKSGAMTSIFAERSAELRREGEALIRKRKTGLSKLE